MAQSLDEVGEAVGGDRAAQLAKGAKALAEALEGGRLDATTVARQQQLFRRMLDAGRTLEKEEREDNNKREAKSAKAGNELKPDNTNATGRAAIKFREPTWEDLRGLSADERRAILEYFKRINAADEGNQSGIGGTAACTACARRWRSQSRSLSCRCDRFSRSVPRPLHAASRGVERYDGVLQGPRSRGVGQVSRCGRALRTALRTPAGVNALLGLERAYAELGWADSLVAPLDTLIAGKPCTKRRTARFSCTRTLQNLGREADLRRAFDMWVREMPTSASPYREYARLLLGKNRSAAADSVLLRAKQALGTTKDLQFEIAQARAAQGQWIESAQAWRQALLTADYLEQAAAYALAPTPSSSRQQVREIFLAPPVEVPSRRALADLEMSWGSPSDGWNALKGLPADSASAEAWSEFAKRAEAEDRWTIAREALEAALRWKRTPEWSIRAGNAAMNAGDAPAALRLAPLSDARGDSATIARTYLPLHARALAALGRPAEAEKLVEAYDWFLSPNTHNSPTRPIAGLCERAI